MFSSLSTLKAHLLPSGSRSRTDWDTVLQTLGRGVAMAFERHCSRKFTRAVGATFILPAPCIGVSLDRFPVETLTAMELRDSGSASWTSILGNVANVSNASGIVQFMAMQGADGDLIRATFTGGYWWDTSENNSGSLPAGATALPDDLRLAWFLQMQDITERMGLLKHGALRTPSAAEEAGYLADLKLLPAVIATLNTYRRFH